jgi:hypothetical protein
MPERPIDIKDRHAWPVAGSILLLFLTAFHAVAGFIISAVGIASALAYYYLAKRKQRRDRQKNPE